MSKAFTQIVRPRPAAAILLALLACAPSVAQEPRIVTFPPAQSKPPPAVRAPHKTQSSGEDTGLIPDAGPSMRKTQDRQPPPPTNLTVMYKIIYGGKLKYVSPDGRAETFEQWKSYKSDGSSLMAQTNLRLADGNNYEYATKPLAAGGFDPVDIPLLFMAGDYDFTFSPTEVENLRRFISGGGTILFNAARGRDEFSNAVIREMGRVFPRKRFMRLSLDHPLFNSRYRVQEVLTLMNGVQSLRAPEVYSIDIGTRAAAILVPIGLGAAWSEVSYRPRASRDTFHLEEENHKIYHPEGKHVVGESAVRLGVNIVAYVLASTEYGRFLAQKFPQYDGSTAAGDVFRFATVQYSGSWDVNPAVEVSVLQGLKDNTGIDVDFAPHAVPLDDPQINHYPLVWMTGHYDFEWTAAEAENLVKYLHHGGMLVASAAAGLKPFDEGFRRELKKALPDAQLVKLPPTHPLFTGGWNPVEKIVYTPAALRDDPGLEYPEFYGVFLNGRLAVVYTPYDLMSGLNRESNVYAKGVTTDDALRLVINIITYALSH